MNYTMHLFIFLNVGENALLVPTFWSYSQFGPQIDLAPRSIPDI